MSNDDTLLFIGAHAETLSSGRRLAPGDILAIDETAGEDDVVERLVEDGLLVAHRDETDAERAALANGETVAAEDVDTDDDDDQAGGDSTDTARTTEPPTVPPATSTAPPRGRGGRPQNTPPAGGDPAAPAAPDETQEKK